METIKNKTIMQYNDYPVVIVGNNAQFITELNELYYYVVFLDKSMRNTCGNDYDVAVHHSELKESTLKVELVTEDEVMKIIRKRELNRSKPYIALISSEYVRDTQISSIGDSVHDLLAEDLVVTIDNQIEMPVEPFQIKDGELSDGYEDSPCDYEAPVYLGIYHYQAALSEEEVRQIISVDERIPLRYVILLPLDSDVSVKEWMERARQL